MHSRSSIAFSIVTISFLLQILLFSVNSYSDDNKISVIEANSLSSKGEVLLIDIRAESEWKHTGVAPQAITLSIHQVGGVPAFESELTRLLNGDKNKPVALICAGGVRSAKLQRYLQQQGFTQVLDVVEGMQGGILTDGWLDHQLPIKAYIE